jgi:hypothetical protein
MLNFDGSGKVGDLGKMTGAFSPDVENAQNRGD